MIRLWFHLPLYFLSVCHILVITASTRRVSQSDSKYEKSVCLLFTVLYKFS